MTAECVQIGSNILGWNINLNVLLHLKIVSAFPKQSVIEGLKYFL